MKKGKYEQTIIEEKFPHKLGKCNFCEKVLVEGEPTIAISKVGWRKKKVTVARFCSKTCQEEKVKEVIEKKERAELYQLKDKYGKEW